MNGNKRKRMDFQSKQLCYRNSRINYKQIVQQSTLHWRWTSQKCVKYIHFSEGEKISRLRILRWMILIFYDFEMEFKSIENFDSKYKFSLQTGQSRKGRQNMKNAEANEKVAINKPNRRSPKNWLNWPPRIIFEKAQKKNKWRTAHVDRIYVIFFCEFEQ